jgi:hypothetical protein
MNPFTFMRSHPLFSVLFVSGTIVMAKEALLSVEMPGSSSSAIRFLVRIRRYPAVTL